MDLYIRSTIRLHSVVFNQLSTGITLPFLLERHIFTQFSIDQDILRNVYVSVLPVLYENYIWKINFSSDF
jgi:hypothetical protein